MKASGQILAPDTLPLETDPEKLKILGRMLALTWSRIGSSYIGVQVPRIRSM
jgi:hypothetical protein